jgi:polyisoprenoid-binding protein YceI
MSRAAFALAAALVLPAAHAAPENFGLDSAHTYPNFKVSHLGFSTMHGQFTSTTGSMTMDRDAGNLSVELTIEAKSITTGHEKRDAHLRSPDFFNVAEFPSLTFKSTGSKWAGDKPVSVTGDLTILGTTRSITLNVESFKCGEDPWKKYRCGADATSSIKRSDFGMKYGLPGIGDEIALAFEIEGVRK